MYQNDRIRHPEKSPMDQKPGCAFAQPGLFHAAGNPRQVFFCSGFQERGFASSGAFRKSTLR